MAWRSCSSHLPIKRSKVFPFSHDPTPGAHAVLSEVQGPDAAGAGGAAAAAGPAPRPQVHGMLQQAQGLPRRRSRSTVANCSNKWFALCNLKPAPPLVCNRCRMEPNIASKSEVPKLISSWILMSTRTKMDKVAVEFKNTRDIFCLNFVFPVVWVCTLNYCTFTH